MIKLFASENFQLVEVVLGIHPRVLSRMPECFFGKGGKSYG
jgi:hypothetical protein